MAEDFEVEIGLNGDEAALRHRVKEVIVEKDPAPLPVGRPAPPMEEYIREAEIAARIVAEKRPINYTAADIEKRVKRAADYAEWRWRGYVAGEIVSL